MKKYNVELSKVATPKKDCSNKPVVLSDKTIQERKNKVLKQMNDRGLEKIIIYGDVEHGSNFEYLVGYYTRFEEALLIVNKCGDMTLVLGNENLNKVSKSRVEANAIHASLFSLPNQPNRNDKTLKELLKDAGVKENTRIGLVGWKLFTSSIEDNKNVFDIPSYIVDTIKELIGDHKLLSNETDLFIGENGVRTTNNANEVAHYEFGASLASDCVLDAMELIEVGTSEFELGDTLVRHGQHTSIVTIAASGPRFVKANMYPTNNTVKIGDSIALTVGYRGGSSSRAGYAVHNESELPKECKDYVEKVAAPYFRAYCYWLEEIKIGCTGKEIFNKIEEILPRSIYGWSLCPGHLTAEEEWMSSPIYENSEEKLQSGMLFQIDIIPSVNGYGGTSAESTILLANEELKCEIKKNYPELWNRIQERIKYIKNQLGIELSEDVLPMCSTVAYLRPYLLNKEFAFTCAK
ncbi:M24 family metallopeptidase [Anaerorhabdus sp.]|uniref:M24 family metallopeptidase n=1 Tax=Anaerorhabdus sp. TaxID=1872524 RepID=UPI002B1EB350|nr:M24 family metallopeptidase [Anaerorhabdus sp.]MEA4875925.1 M24 family metallopeptidase [Anaerorhabdus sp.]